MAGPWEAYRTSAPTNVSEDGPWSSYAKDDNNAIYPPPIPGDGRNGGGGSGNGGSPVGGNRQSVGDSLAGFAGKIRNGLTFGFGDELSAAAATPLNMAVNAIRGRDVGSVADNYNSLLESDRNIGQQFNEEHPVIGIGSELAGGLASGNAAAKALPSVFGLAPASASLGAKALQGAKAGAVGGGIYGFGSGEGGTGKRLQNAATNAAIGGALGGVATPAIDATLGGFTRGLSGQAPKVGKSASELRADASRLYQRATEKGGVLKSSVTDNFVKQAESMVPQTAEGRLILGENDVTKLIGRIADPEDGLIGKPLTLQAAQEIDEGLTNLISNHSDAVTGKLSKEGNQLKQLQTSLRNSISNATEANIEGGKAGFDTWNQAKKTWAQSIKANEIERIVERANMTDNPASALRTGFKNYVTRKENLNGLTKEQVSALQRAANTGLATDALRVFGSRLIPYAAGAAGAAGGPQGAALAAGAGYIGSTASRAGATALQNNRAANALNMITAGERLPMASERLGQRTRSVFGLTEPVTPAAPSSPSGMVGGGSATMSQSVQPQQPTIQRSPNSVRLNSRPEVSAAIGAATLPVLAGTGGIASMMGAPSYNGDNEPPRGSILPPPGNSRVENPQDFNHDDFLDTLTNGVESNGERNAKNPKSSALGPYQIIRSTFAGLVKKYDPETYKKGNFQQLRTDPEYSRFIAKKYSEENVKRLVSEGLPINKTTAYLAYFADGKTASKLLKSPANAPASSVFSSEAMNANPFLKGKTVGEVVQWANRKVNRS